MIKVIIPKKLEKISEQLDGIVEYWATLEREELLDKIKDDIEVEEG